MWKVSIDMVAWRILSIFHLIFRGWLISMYACFLSEGKHLMVETFLHIKTWFVFVRASLHMHREEKPARCYWALYCTYDTHNMFWAFLCPSSGIGDYMCVITAYGVQCLVAGCRGSGAVQQGVVSRKRDAAHVQHPSFGTLSLLHCTWPPTTSNQALHTIGGNNTHIVSISWWWA